jgi:hypothetical protein
LSVIGASIVAAAVAEVTAVATVSDLLKSLLLLGSMLLLAYYTQCSWNHCCGRLLCRGCGYLINKLKCQISNIDNVRYSILLTLESPHHAQHKIKQKHAYHLSPFAKNETNLIFAKSSKTN